MAIQYTENALAGVVNELPNMLLQTIQANRQMEYDREQAAIAAEQQDRALDIQEETAESQNRYYNRRASLAERQQDFTEENYDEEFGLQEKQFKEQQDQFDEMMEYRYDQLNKQYGQRTADEQMKRLQMDLQADRGGAFNYLNEAFDTEGNLLVETPHGLRLREGAFEEINKDPMQIAQEYAQQVDVPEGEDPQEYRNLIVGALMNDQAWRDQAVTQFGTAGSERLQSIASQAESLGIGAEALSDIIARAPRAVGVLRQKRFAGNPVIGAWVQSTANDPYGQAFPPFISGQLGALPESQLNMSDAEIAAEQREAERFGRRASRNLIFRQAFGLPPVSARQPETNRSPQVGQAGGGAGGNVGAMSREDKVRLYRDQLLESLDAIENNNPTDEESIFGQRNPYGF